MSILVIAELREGALRPASLAAITAGKRAAEVKGTSFDILALGKGAASVAEGLKGFGAGKVLVSEDAAVADYTAEAYASAAAAVMKAGGYNVALAAATTTGKDTMPRLAGLLDAGMVSDVVGFQMADGTLAYVRPMYAGNALATIAVDTPIAILTVRETAFDPAAAGAGASAVETIAAQVDATAAKARFQGFNLSKSARPELSEASIIVSCGRGVKDASGVAMVEKLADTLAAALGASRAVVDEGLLPNDLQVGQTGKIVAPDLYIAIGISGAIQHVAGMKDSKIIVAINKDEEAPIFEVADYGLVEDFSKAVPALIEKIIASR